MPFFSVIIPTYNRRELLQKALESVWVQTFTDYEVIVIDDGSTDGTWEYLQSLGSRIKAFKQENAGPGAARNLGLQHVTGRYITFLDSDDIWFSWTLETFKQVIDGYPDSTLISGAHIDFEGDRELKRTGQVSLSVRHYDNYLAAAFDSLWLGVPGTLVRADAMKRIGFSSHNINSEDNDLWLRLGVEPGFIYIMTPLLFAYRRHAASRIGDIMLGYAGALRMVQSENAGIYPGGSKGAKQRLTIIGRHIRPVVVSCARHCLPKEVWILYSRTFWWNLTAGRLKFLVGVPLLILSRLISGVLRK